MRTLSVYIACVLLASAASAQRIPDPVDNSLEIQVHDVRAVLEAIGLRHDLRVPALAEQEPEGAEVLHRRDRLQDVVALCRAFVAPPLEDDSSLQPLGSDLLVLRGSPQQQASLGGILKSLSRLESDTITVECELVKVPQAAFAESMADLLGLEEIPKGGGGTVAHTTLDGDRAARLQAALRSTAGVVAVKNPRLHLLAAMHGSLEITNTVLYRQDYEVEVKGNSFKVWPITGKVKDGLVLELRAAPVAEETLGVAVRAMLSDLQRPIPTFETTLAGTTKKVTVDLPNWTERRLDADLRIGENELGVIVGGAAEDPERLLLLVRAVSR